jgi:HD-GYP domain-containing protein (c-di-GMP phosphodiesterase class II)
MHKLGQEVQLILKKLTKSNCCFVVDLGNLLLPDSLLRKPGPLDKKKRKMVSEHPTWL